MKNFLSSLPVFAIHVCDVVAVNIKQSKLMLLKIPVCPEPNEVIIN